MSMICAPRKAFKNRFDLQVHQFAFAPLRLSKSVSQVLNLAALQISHEERTASGEIIRVRCMVL